VNDDNPPSPPERVRPGAVSAEQGAGGLPPGHGRAGALARLAREDHTAMTAAARSSENYPGSLDRWMRTAREQEPGIGDGEAAELAVQLCAGYFRGISAAGVAARQRAAADAAREVGAGPVTLECPACSLQWEITARPDGSMPVNARCPTSQGGCGKLRRVPRASTRRKMTRPQLVSLANDPRAPAGAPRQHPPEDDAPNSLALLTILERWASSA
jgi:hypothetical protein